MHYSQKYCIVAFLIPQVVGNEFSMQSWPLHVTLADVFAIDISPADIEPKLAGLAARQHSIVVGAGEDTTLGTTPVVILEQTSELHNLHEHIVDLLEANGAKFNTPDFTRKGFLPHCTIQKNARVHKGSRLVLDNISLVDMFPGGDWQQRKVLSINKLSPS